MRSLENLLLRRVLDESRNSFQHLEYRGNRVSITRHATHDLLDVLLILPDLLPHLVDFRLQRLLRPLDLLLYHSPQVRGSENELFESLGKRIVDCLLNGLLQLFSQSLLDVLDDLRDDLRCHLVPRARRSSYSR